MGYSSFLLLLFAALAAAQMSPHPPSADWAATEYCYHTEDPAAHQCYDGCATKDFKNKGLKQPGVCNPHVFDKVTSTKVVEQCSDGLTNIKYCNAPLYAVNVTQKIKGEGASKMLEAAFLAAVAPVKCKTDADCPCSYCQNGAFCHGLPNAHGVFPGCCKDDSDCGSDSYCMTKPGQKGPFHCHGAAAMEQVAMSVEAAPNAQHCESMSGSKHSITVTNPTGSEIKVRTCDKYNPVSGAPCVGNPLKANHYVDCPNTIPAGGASTFTFNGDTQYIAFTDSKALTEISELWPSASGVWPSSYAVKPAPFENLLKTATTTERHYIQPTTSHCEDVVGDTTVSWWKANGWKYDSWVSGKCPIKYNFVNEVDHPAPRVTHRTLGIHTQLAGFNAFDAAGNNICDPTGYVHAIGSDGSDKGKCLEIAFGGGKLQSKFWQAEGWKYSKPLGKLWSDGGCDRSAFPTVSSLEKDYNGWTDEKNSGYGCGGVNMTKYSPKSALASVVPLDTYQL